MSETALDQIKAKYKVSETQRAAPAAATTFRQRSTEDLVGLVNKTTERGSLSQMRGNGSTNEMAAIMGEVAKSRAEMARRMSEYQGYQTELKDLLGANPGLIRGLQLYVLQKFAPSKYAAKVGEYAEEGFITVTTLVDKMSDLIATNREELKEIRELERTLRKENLAHMNHLQDEHIAALRESAKELYGSSELEETVQAYRTDISTVDQAIAKQNELMRTAQQTRDLEALRGAVTEADGLYALKRSMMEQLDGATETATGKRLKDLRTANRIESTRQAYAAALTMQETLDALAESTEMDVIMYDHIGEYHLATLKRSATINSLVTQKDKIHKTVQDFAWFQEQLLDMNARASATLAYESLDMLTRDVLDENKLASIRQQLDAQRLQRVEIADQYTSYLNRAEKPLATPAETGTKRYNALG